MANISTTHHNLSLFLFLITTRVKNIPHTELSHSLHEANHFPITMHRGHRRNRAPTDGNPGKRAVMEDSGEMKDANVELPR